MANIKITELNEILKKDNADVLPIVDVSANETKKIAIEDLLDKNIALIAVTDTEPAECSTGDKYYNTTTKKIYTAINTDVWDEDGEDPISGILYIVYDEQASYSWDGTDLVSVGGGKEDIVISDTEPTDSDWKIWVDSSEQADNTYYNDNGTATQFKATTFDTLPVGTEVDYDGETVPSGWTEIPETNCYKKLLTTPVSADSSGIITQSIENYTNYDFLLIEYSSSTDVSIQTMLIPTFTINSTKHFYPTFFQASNVYESIMLTFPTTTQIKLEIDTIAGWTKNQLRLLSITGIKMNMIN